MWIVELQGIKDFHPRKITGEIHFFYLQVLVISEKVTKIAAGSYHSVALTASGKIYTWGYNGKYQLGRQGPSQDTPGLAKVEVELWYAFPGAIPGLGAAHGKTVIFEFIFWAVFL